MADGIKGSSVVNKGHYSLSSRIHQFVDEKLQDDDIVTATAGLVEACLGVWEALPQCWLHTTKYED